MNYVYFMKPKDQPGPIKIGISADPHWRLQHFQFWSPVQLEIAAVVPGNHALERRIQGLFIEQHSHGEWFWPSRALTGLIERLAAGEPIDRLIDMNATVPKFGFKKQKRKTAPASLWHMVEAEAS